MSDIGSWSTTAASNNFATPDGWPEGQAPSTVNDCAREMMRAVKAQIDDCEWFNRKHTPTRASATSFTVATDLTSEYHAGRRLKLYDYSTLYGTISSSSYSAPNTTVNVTMDSGSLTASLTSFARAIMSVTNRSFPSIVYDTAPKLGGNLDVNGKTITSASNGDIPITPDGTGNVILDGQKWPQADGSANQVLKTDGSAQLSWTTVTQAATQAEMEAAASNTVYVSPGRFIYSPYALKAWAHMVDTGTASLGQSAGMASVTDVGVGRYRLTMSNTMSAATNAPVALAQRPDSNDRLLVSLAQGVAMTTTQFTLQCYGETGASVDASVVTVLVAGDI